MICKIKKKDGGFVVYERVFFCFMPIYNAVTLSEAQYFLTNIHDLQYDHDTKTYRKRPEWDEFEG